MYDQRTYSTRDGERRRGALHAHALPESAGGRRVTVERRTGSERRVGFDPCGLHLFKGIEREVIESLLAGCPLRTFRAENVVLRPGEINRHIYLVIAGPVRVHLDAVHSANGWHVDIGACIGELSMIDGKPASAFVVAEPGSQLLVIDQETFWNRVASHPQVARNLLGVLSERMRANNEAVLRGLQKQHELALVQKELALAREIQESMLVSPSSAYAGAGSMDVAASMKPAREVGGDLYDVFRTTDGMVFFMIGDVSDKGLASALFMARTLDIVRVVTRMLPIEAAFGRVARIVACVNDELCERNGAAMFVTALVGVIDPSSGDVAICSAGHPAPYLLRAADAAVTAVPLPPGIPLGLVAGRHWPVEAFRLACGDVLVGYTDGVTEARSPRDELFGEARLEAVLRSTGAGTPEQIIRAIETRVQAFIGSTAASDDTTLIALRRLPATGER